MIQVLGNGPAMKIVLLGRLQDQQINVVKQYTARACSRHAIVRKYVGKRRVFVCIHEEDARLKVIIAVASSIHAFHQRCLINFSKGN